MGTAKCCCPTCSDCKIAEDKFNRDNTTNIGADWDVLSGSWEILGRELAVTTNNSLVLNQGPPPDGAPRHVVTVDFKGEDAGDQIQVWVASADQNNGLYAQLTLESTSACGVLGLYQVVSGTPTLLIEIVVPALIRDVWHTVKVCYRPENNSVTGQLAAVVTNSINQTRYTYAAVMSTGTLAGLGTGLVGTRVYFDNFCWQRHYIAADDFGDPYTPVDDVRADLSCPSCTSSCIFVRDDFTRADNDNVGCDWEELTGAWSISGGKLHTTSPGYLRSRTQHPNGYLTMYMSGIVSLADDTDHVRVIVSMTDANNYLALDIQAGSECGFIKLIRHYGGSDTTISTVVPVLGLSGGTTIPWWVCFGRATVDSADTYLVGAAGNGVVRSTSTVAGIGTRFGLAVFSLISPIQWDNIQVSFTYDPIEHIPCRPCNGYFECVWATTHIVDGLSCDWEVVTGTWDNFSTSSSNAQILTKSENPLGTNRAQVRGTFLATGVGDSAKVFLAGGALVATFRVGIDCGSITVTGPTGTDTIVVAHLGSNVPHYFCVSYDGGTLTAGVLVGAQMVAGHRERNIHRQISVITAAPNSWTGGLGTGSVTGTVSFEATYSLSYGDNEVCGWCSSCVAGDYDAADGMKCEFEVTNSTLGTGQTGPAVLTSTQYAFINGGPIGARFVATTFTTNTSGQIIRVHVANDRSRNGPWGQIEMGAMNSDISLSSGQTGVISGFPAGTTVTIWLCLSGSQLMMTVNPTPGMLPPALSTLIGSGSSTGTWGGVTMTAGSGSIGITEFVVGPLSHGFLEENTCNSCINVCTPCSNNQFPNGFFVSVSGIAAMGLGPSCCTNYNGTYATVATSTCLARWESTTPCADPGFVTVELIDAPTTVTIRVGAFLQPNWPSPGMFVKYETTVPKPLDCSAISNLVIPYTSHTGVTQCNVAASSVMISAF